MILGIVLTVVVVLAAPRLLKSDGEEGFFRPRPNPDARPAATSSDEGDDPVVPDEIAPAPEAGSPPETQYDFYTMLPADEVALTDAQIAASARAEEARQREQADPDAADLAQTPSTALPDTAATPPRPAASAAAGGDDARYILQAGAFSASDDAEALKARIALLGLGARVETAEVGGKTVHRVRMGPYATASELAEAKQKLGNGGLPALAIKSK
ncbi:SPOR domain-containing protein [Luteimonas vadosa]|uniref:SPOR domain-containing protein n=2 Tax=Luteimonas vadosa TaxID=1165507 RepID=A0ABP9DYP2_9GAMM